MIGFATQRGDYIYIYDERGMAKGSFHSLGGSLQGYTTTTINVKKGPYMYIYDESGRQKSSTYVG